MRLSLTDSSGVRKFFYDGNDVIQEHDSDWSSVTKEYTHGPWVDEPLSMTEHATGQPNSTYYLMKDRLGSIINVLDENETLKTTYSYDAFGEPTATYHSGQIDCAYRFTGREFDSRMGNYFSRARYYNQSLGRFFSRDPIMSLSSLYVYCHNSPTNFRDPMGLVSGSIGRSLAGASMSASICVSVVRPGLGSTILAEEKKEEPVLPQPDPPPGWWLADLNGDGELSDDEIYYYYFYGPGAAAGEEESTSTSSTDSTIGFPDWWEAWKECARKGWLPDGPGPPMP